jgi:cysteine-S-conjugate beta-lyase
MDQQRSNRFPDGSLNPTISELRARRSHKWSAYGPDVLPAFVAELDVPLASEISEALLAAVSHHDLGYAPRPPATRLAPLTSAWMRQWGLDIAEEQVDVIADVVVGVDVVLDVFAGPGDQIIVCPPLYSPLRIASRVNGRVPVEVPLLHVGDRYVLDLDGISRAFDAGARVMLLCQPHNPTGTVFAASELESLGRIVRSYGAWIVSDEIHAPLTFEENVFTSALSSTVAPERTVVVTSTSKTWNTAGLKCAVIVSGTTELADKIRVLTNRRRAGVGILGVVAMEAALEHGDRWRRALVAHLAERRTQLFEGLRSELPLAITSPPEASYLAWVDLSPYGFVPSGAPSDEGTLHAEMSASDWLLEHGKIAVSPGRDFGNAYQHGHVRINFGTSEALVTEILGRITAAVRQRTNTP